MQLLIYFFIGLICAVVNIATFSFLMLFGLSVKISTPASFLVAAALNYILCIALLFRHKVKWNTAGELVAYLVTIVLMGVLDYGLTIGLVTLGLAPTLAKAIATFFGFVGNFLLRRFLVFPGPEVVRI